MKVISSLIFINLLLISCFDQMKKRKVDDFRRKKASFSSHSEMNDFQKKLKTDLKSTIIPNQNLEPLLTNAEIAEKVDPSDINKNFGEHPIHREKLNAQNEIPNCQYGLHQYQSEELEFFKSSNFRIFEENCNFVIKYCVLILFLNEKYFKISINHIHFVYNRLYSGQDIGFFDYLFLLAAKVDKKIFEIFLKSKFEDNLLLASKIKSEFQLFFSKISSLCNQISLALTKTHIIQLYLSHYEFINYPVEEPDSYFIFKEFLNFIKNKLNMSKIHEFCFKSNPNTVQNYIDEDILVDFTVMIYLVFVKPPSIKEQDNFLTHFEKYRNMFKPHIQYKKNFLANSIKECLKNYFNNEKNIFCGKILQEIKNIIAVVNLENQNQ